MSMRRVAPNRRTGITLVFATPLYHDAIQPDDSRYFQTREAAWQFLQSAPECVDTNQDWPYKSGSRVWVYASDGCKYPRPEPWGPPPY
jgi:hypothetical protein